MIKELNEYQSLASKTMKDGLCVDEANKYCCLKMAEEVGEINSLIAKSIYHGKNYNKEDLLSECGDLFWYLANFATTNGFTLEQIATHNIEKLQKRHGEKYNSDYYKS